MWNIFKSKEEKEILQLMRNYFKGDGMDRLARLQAKYMQEEHFNQIEIKRKKDIEEKYNWLKAISDNNEELTPEEIKEYKWCKFMCTGSL